MYLISPETYLLKTRSRRYKVIHTGPFVIYIILENFQYMSISIEGKILSGIFHFNRLKQTYLRTTTCPVYTLVDLKVVLNLEIRINWNHGAI